MPVNREVGKGFGRVVEKLQQWVKSKGANEKVGLCSDYMRRPQLGRDVVRRKAGWQGWFTRTIGRGGGGRKSIR